MSATVLYMFMSLDGFITGPSERMTTPLGDGGGRLHEWSFNYRIPVNGQIYEVHGHRRDRRRPGTRQASRWLAGTR